MLGLFLPCEHYAAIITDMGETITIAEIQSRFQSEWVLLEDPQTNESLDVKSGKVLYHSKDRDEGLSQGRRDQQRESLRAALVHVDGHRSTRRRAQLFSGKAEDHALLQPQCDGSV